MAKAQGAAETVAPAQSPVQTIAFGSDKGGIGKSKCAELRITRHMMVHGILPTIIEVEAEARLARFYGTENVNTFRIAQNKLSEIEHNPALLYETWDAVGNLAMEAKGEVVLDIGANLTKAFALWLNEYGESGPFGNGESLTFCAVTTGDRLAIESASHALGYVSQAAPASSRWLVINERDALFPLPSNAKPVTDMVSAHGLRGVVRLGACMSSCLADAMDIGMPLHEAVNKPEDFWVNERGYKKLEAVRLSRRLNGWIKTGVVDLFDPIDGPMPD